MTTSSLCTNNKGDKSTLSYMPLEIKSLLVLKGVEAEFDAYLLWKESILSM